MASEIEYVIEPSKRKLFDWRELWQFRELFYFFTWRDIKVRYKQTYLGIFWVVIQPVFTVLIFSLFFGKTLDVNPQNLAYPVFVFSGLLLWNLFSSSVNNAGNSMLANAPIIKKIYFPRIIIPVAAMLVSFIDFLIAFVLFLILLIYYSVSLDFLQVLLFWPLAFLLLILSSIGISCLLSALTVKYKDFRYVIPFALQVGLFVSPIIYPLSIIESPFLSYLLAINPMYGVITLFRLPMVGGVPDFYLILVSILSTMIFLLSGIYYFKKTEDYFADIA